MAIELGLLILGAYLLGSVPAAYLVARWSRGIDLRRYGSGSIGASNLWKSTNKYLALPVIFFDLGKGMLTVWVAYLVGLGIVGQVAVALVTITGHNWPIFLRLRGGRGMLTTLGIALFLPAINNSIPWGAIAGITCAVVGTFIIHNTPLGVGTGVAALPLVSWGAGEPLPITLGFLAMFVIMVVKRLTAPRTPLTASVTKRQLIVNRLLFDRDIRDREAWLSRRSFKHPEKQRKD